MIRLITLVAGLAALLASGCTSGPPPPAPGFFVTSTYGDGPPAVIEVSIGHATPQDRVTAVELILPGGETVFAHRLDTETVTETRIVDPGYGGSGVGVGVGGGFGGGGGGFVGTGIGFGFPIGGGGRSEAVTKEIRTEAEITVPDPPDYRANWQAYKIRVTMAGADGVADTTVIGPPQP